MGRLLSLLKSVEQSLHSRFGRWMQEVSIAGDKAADDIASLQAQIREEDWKDSVAVAITSALPAYTRVGNTITFNAPGALPPQDGVAIVTTDPPQRALLAIGTSPDNGIWDVIDSGGATAAVLQRSSDAATSADVTSAMRVPIAAGGTLYGGKVFYLGTSDPIVLNTTALTFVEEQGLPAGTVVGQALTWNGVSAATWLGPSPLYVPPMDWSTFIGIVNANAYVRPVVMGAGAWTVDAQVSLASGADIVMNPGVVITSTMTPTGTQSHCVFYSKATTSTKSGKLNTSVTVGATSFSYALLAGSPPVAGDIIQISKNLSTQNFVVQSVAGGGPYTINVDRPITLAFTANDPVAVLASRPTDIRIEGNGARVTGTGDRVVEIVTGYRCRVRGLRYDTGGGAMTDITFSFDIGGLDVAFEDCVADGTGAPGTNYGFALESAEDGRLVGCRALNTPFSGFALIDCVSSVIDDCHFEGHATDAGSGGFNVGSGSSLGCFDCAINNSSSRGGVYGMVLNGDTRTKVSTSSLQFAATANIAQGAGTSIDAQFDDFSSTDSPVAFDGGSGQHVTLTNARLSASVTALKTAGDIEARGLKVSVTSPSAAGIDILNGGTVARFAGLSFDGTANCLVYQSGGRLEVDDATFVMGDNSIALYAPGGGGVIHARNVKTSGSAVGTKGADLTTTTLRQGAGCDFSSCASTVTLHANAYWNRGTFQTAAGTPTARPFPDIKATDRVLLQRIVDSGTGVFPNIVVNPGVGFTDTGAGGENSTYAYLIE